MKNFRHIFISPLCFCFFLVSNLFAQKCPAPDLVFKSGFYSNNVLLAFNRNNYNQKIYYTTDGSIPAANSVLYESPVLLTRTTVIRAVTTQENFEQSEILNATLFVNENSDLAIISLITDPDDLWDYNTGIYVKGPNAEPTFPYYGANFWNDKEIVGAFEFFSDDNEKVYEANCGVKIYGGWSRAFNQKSVALFARSKYGTSKFQYEFFPWLNIDKYESLVLRNSGNDWTYTLFRDALMHTVVAGLNFETLAYKPVVVFLNGEYWGIQNLREKVNEDYIASHFNLDPDSIDLLEDNSAVVEGSAANYRELINFISFHDLSIQSNYNTVSNWIDIDNFIDYYTSEIYFDNTDWPGNNIKFWRPQTPAGKWRWILFDTDFGFGIWDVDAYKNNTLAFALNANGPGWPNPPWSTFLIRSLLRNSDFKNKFINRFLDLSNSAFKFVRVEAIIDSIKQALTGEINKHISKWNAFQYSNWIENINVLKIFAEKRIQYLRAYYMQYFQLNKVSKIALDLVPEGSGSIIINSINPKNYPWTGFYLARIPVEVTAVPGRGFKFLGWEGRSDSSTGIKFNPENDESFKAVFEKADASDTLVINEINYNSHPDYDCEDWVELYNPMNTEVNLSNWSFLDEVDSHSFSFPEGSAISSNGYFVLCRDTSAFKLVHPDVNNIVGNFDFGLSNAGDALRIFDQYYNLIDSVMYDDSDPWPVEADGTGQTLALINPEYDNTDPVNWKASQMLGTPGEKNDVFVSVENEDQIDDVFELNQNYPNPFNSQTTIAFSLEKNSHVKLELYNVIGEKIMTLVNRAFEPGKHALQFEGSKLSSGVYIYKIIAGDYISSRKMIVIK